MNAPEGRTDEELLASFLRGDEASFGELMGRHEQKVFAVALKITGSRADALDATQDAFVTAFRRADTFRGEAAFGTWLFRIAINAAKDVVRKRKPTEELPEDGGGVVGGRVDDAVALRMDLSAALRDLPDEYREAVVMHDLGGIPYEQIAEDTGVRIGTVKSRISRGRRRLAELMEPGTGAASSKERR
jgi:RNA polymerase sigma-70 factor (ECF subfamily)